MMRALPLFLALLAIQAGYRASAQTPPFSLTISAPKLVYSSGEGVMIEVAIRNLSAKPISAQNADVLGEGPARYKVVVTEAIGRTAPATAWVPWLSHVVWTCSLAGCILPAIAPGETSHDDVFITRFYDLTIPGKYTVQLTAAWTKLPLVKSNTLQITIANTTDAQH